jgi:nicotinamide mononucleotide transporter
MPLDDTTSTLIEALAFATALGYVLGSIRQWPGAWPLAAISAALYGALFVAAKLYGQAALQVFFVAASLWGWWQWLHGRRDGAALSVATLDARARLWLALAWLGGWLAGGAALLRFTDASVPFLDLFPTAGSVIGQLLTARKYVEAWPVWLLVNVASVALFVHQQLWLTALLYAIFIVLSLVGWRAWRASLPRTATAP